MWYHAGRLHPLASGLSAESRYGAACTFREAGNPVLTGDKPREEWHADTDGHPVIYDEETQELNQNVVQHQHL